MGCGLTWQEQSVSVSTVPAFVDSQPWDRVVALQYLLLKNAHLSVWTHAAQTAAVVQETALLQSWANP